jgi:hypothetical protein
MRINLLLVLTSLALAFGTEMHGQKFIHPGINQTSADLQYMREQVRKGQQPWKEAFERLKGETDLDFEIRPFTHVMRGSYGRPNIGGNDLSKGADMAYDCALLWYITGEKPENMEYRTDNKL